MVPWLVFGGYCVAVVGAGWIAWRARAAVADPPVPERELDAPELALLRGRGTGAVAACVGRLLLREELVVVPGGVTFNDLTVRDGAFVAREPAPDATLKPLDRAVLAEARAHRLGRRGPQYDEPGLSVRVLADTRKVRAELARTRHALSEEGLLHGPPVRARFRRGLLPLRALAGAGVVAVLAIVPLGETAPLVLLVLATTAAAIAAVSFVPPAVRTSERLVRETAEEHPVSRSEATGDADAFARGIALHGPSVLHRRYPRLAPPPSPPPRERRGGRGSWHGGSVWGGGCGTSSGGCGSGCGGGD
ncbi:TIGR04222 domain-containing membrane protein [Streptomyces sp. M54]|uniref:TIGR04222 domain-containing membrane protein n=1 Tax=Streptomyces sp. M54 TaxID=2759525 RepID=UPI001A901ED5|nr:TIGR04222 domain-containing membrane protein [Streptomyces sp. M54]QSS94056.1 TIGR04222 domain-containing membrane protein [Streptomyces sp. M54]